MVLPALGVTATESEREGENNMNVVDIRKELASMTENDLKMLGISREVLHRCFAEGVRMMKAQNITPGGRIRPVAVETSNGEWRVILVQYSPHSDRDVEAIFVLHAE